MKPFTSICLLMFAVLVQANPVCRGAFKTKSGVETTFEIFTSPRFLQFNIRCVEPEMKKLKYFAPVHDVSVWKGDSIELFVKPAETGSTIAHFAVSPNGSMYDAAVRNQSRNPQWTPAGIEVKTSRDNDSWSVVMKIPVAVLTGLLTDKTDQKNCGPDTWSFCIVRNRYAGKREMACCAPCSHWLAHEKYLKLKNVQAEYSEFCWKVSGLQIGRTQQRDKNYAALLEGTLDNSGKRMKIVTVTARLTDVRRTKKITLAEQKLAMDKGQVFRLGNWVDIPQCGKYMLEVIVSDEKGMLSYHFLPVNIEFVPIKLSIVSGAYRGKDLFHSMPAKDLIFKVRTTLPVKSSDTCELVIRDSEQKVIVRKKCPAKEALSKNIRVSLPHRKTGKYVCEVKFSTKGLPAAKTVFRILPKVDNEIYLAENGNFVRNGKEFFPVGGFGSLGSFAPEGFEKSGEFSVDYGPVRPVSQQKLAAAAKSFEKYGSRSMPYPEPPELWSHPVTPEGAKRALRPLPPEAAKRIAQVLNGWKGSNFIFGWYLVDEPAESRCLPEYFEQLAAVCHETDPYHMTFMTFNSSTPAITYGNACDAAILDFFPGFHEKGKARTLDYIVRMAEETARGLGGGKTLISAPPLYAYTDSSILVPRYATYAEMRCMVYSSLTCDSVRGICWNTSPRVRTSLDNYVGVPRISSNLKALEKFWLSRDRVKLSFTGKNASKLQWIAKKVNGKLYLLTVNPTDSALKVSVKLPAGPDKLRELDSEKPQFLRPGTLNDLSFAPLQVRIFSADPAAPELITVEQVRKIMRDFEERELKSGNLCYYKRGSETIYSPSYVKSSYPFNAPGNRRMVNDGLCVWSYHVKQDPKKDPSPYLGIRFKKTEKVSRIEVFWANVKNPDPSKLVLETAGNDGVWKKTSVLSCKTERNGNIVKAVFKLRPAEMNQFRFCFPGKNVLPMNVCEIKAFN